MEDLSGGMSRYEIINDGSLPSNVRDEICNDCPGNDSGRLLNPMYNPKLKTWLDSIGKDSNKCYIIWFSW